MRTSVWVVCVVMMGCVDPVGGSDGGTGGGGGGSATGSGSFTYSFDDKVFRIEARVGASIENVSTKLDRFATMPGRDRWLIPSVNGAWLVLVTDRLTGSDCMAIAPKDLSSLTCVVPMGGDVYPEGTPAVSNAGDVIVFSASGGPHMLDLWVTRKSGATWGTPEVITTSSTAANNNAPALTFDGQRVLFDCGAQRDPESGNNDNCEVKLDGTGFKVIVRHTTLPGGRNQFVQFPHDSLDGVLFQGSWPIGADSPETIWLLPASGPPTAIGKNFNNTVSPCGLRDGRFGLLWLDRPGNSAGAHELTLVARDGTLLGTLTPGVDVTDIGIGCSD